MEKERLEYLLWRIEMFRKILYFTKNNSVIHSAYVMDNDALKIINTSIDISQNAFKNDLTVECVLMNPAVKVVEESAFENCKELQLVEYVDGDEILENGKNDNKIKMVSSSDNISIQYQAFKDCTKLHTVVFPCLLDKGKIVIEKEAFLGCKELRTIIILDEPKSQKKTSSKDTQITKPIISYDIADDAFKGCDTDKLVFVVSQNSDAERYAREHGFHIVHPDNIV